MRHPSPDQFSLDFSPPPTEKPKQPERKQPDVYEIVELSSHGENKVIAHMAAFSERQALAKFWHSQRSSFPDKDRVIVRKAPTKEKAA